MSVFFRGTHTESAGTVITEVIPNSGDGIPTIEEIVYSNGATAHTMTIMRPVGRTNTIASSRAAELTLELADTSPGKTTAGASEELASGDYLGWIDENGTVKVDSIDSVSGSVITLDNAVGTNVSLGATVWALYEIGRSTHTTITIPASHPSTVPIVGPIKAGFGHQAGIQTTQDGVGDILFLTIDNATNAGTLLYMRGSWGASDNLNL